MAEVSADGGVKTGIVRRREAARQLTSIQLVLAVALTFGLVLALNFSSRIKLDRDLGRIHDEFVREIDALFVEQKRLLAELNYVTSDAYVEYWARDEGKMVRDGEVLILPQGVGITDAEPLWTRRLVEFETTVPEPENWELWWALFFDEPPPELD
ncbi:MAG: hypothetical protein OXG78_04355 [Chloroflexi bacterium]|nr:hypothetical protein [Chloroflexota bacterium]